MRVFVVDQSLFGLLYDVQFSAALAEAGAEVTLVGRRLRPHEEMTRGGFKLLPLFYGFAESLPGRLKPLARVSKGLEHARHGGPDRPRAPRAAGRAALRMDRCRCSMPSSCGASPVSPRSC